MSAPRAGTISAVTRRDIASAVVKARFAWWGRLDEIEFLARLHDLERLPSTDSRCPNAMDDIIKHRRANDDWGDDWVFAYPPFRLADGPDDIFLRFLCETLHPEVRGDRDEVVRLRSIYNNVLAADGWELHVAGELSGRPIFGSRRRSVQNVLTPAGFPIDADAFLGSIVEVLKQRGRAREIGIIVASDASIDELNHDNWNGGTTTWGLTLALDLRVYATLAAAERQDAASTIETVATEFFAGFSNDNFGRVHVGPRVAAPSNWRTAAAEYLMGAGVTNQGRVRSDNIAARECDGLLFRSEPEIQLYKAFKRRGVTFAPLPVFLRGGDSYARLEPDFVVIKDGVLMVVEVDGDTYHVESPADAHARLKPLDHEGAKIERVKAGECATAALAEECATRVLAVLERRIKQRT